MKKLIFVLMLLLIPALFAFSQDEGNKEKIPGDIKPVKMVCKEVQCPDCQGFGWIVVQNIFKSSALKDRLSRNPNVSNPSNISELSRMVCPYCGGKKTVSIIYKVY